MQRTLVFAGLILAVLMAGCTGNSASGNFELLVSDAPAAIDDFESLTVTFDKARIFKSGGNSSVEEVSLTGQQVDLTTVKGAKAASLVNTTLEPGRYTKIELHTSSVNGVVNGSDVDVKLPSEKLQITKPFTVSENSTTQFVFDIQVVLRGNAQDNQGYILKPVISESGVAGKDVDIERTGKQNSQDEPDNAGKRKRPPQDVGAGQQ